MKTAVKKVQLTVYVPEKLADELEEVIAEYRLRKKEKLTKSEIVVQALRGELERLKKALNE